jgi:hypothetical protein
MRSRCSRSIQPTNVAMIKGSGSTHGVYAKAASMEFSDITPSISSLAGFPQQFVFQRRGDVVTR